MNKQREIEEKYQEICTTYGLEYVSPIELAKRLNVSLEVVYRALEEMDLFLPIVLMKLLDKVAPNG